MRGLRRGTSARLVESISLHAQNARRLLCSSRLALSTTLVCSRVLKLSIWGRQSTYRSSFEFSTARQNARRPWAATTFPMAARSSGVGGRA